MVTAKFISAKNFMKTAEVNKTRFKQDPRTGHMIGRDNVRANRTDGTSVLKANQDIDIDGDGDIDERDIRGGELLGRLGSGEKKPAKVKVTQHFSKGRFIGKHYRKYPAK